MRVVAGKYGGRHLESPRGHLTHPMSEKMRGAIFSALGDIEGLTCLDAFSGSGALGIEAYSRGASSVICIEKNKLAAVVIDRNINNLGLKDHVIAIQSGVESWLKTTINNFDIIIADPPYDRTKEQTIAFLARRLKPGGVFVLSWPTFLPPPSLGACLLIKHKTYGDAQLAFYRLA